MVDFSSGSGGLIEHGFSNSVFIIPGILTFALLGPFSSFICLRDVACGLKTPTCVDSLGSIALAYVMERMAGEDGIEWESAKLEPLGSRTEGSMPADIEVAVNFGFCGYKLFLCLSERENKREEKRKLKQKKKK